MQRITAVTALLVSMLGLGDAIRSSGRSLGSSTAWARGPGGDRGRIERLMRQAMDLYDRLDFDKARNRLQDAYGLAEKAGMDRDPLAAKVLVDLGIVYASGLKDHDKAVQVFQRAFAIDPDGELDPSLATPDVKSAWDDAHASGGGGGRGRMPKSSSLSLGSGGGGAASAPRSTEGGGGVTITHTPVEEAPRGEPIVVMTSVSGLKSGSRVVLRWREQSEHSFEQDAMVKRGDRYEAQVPASATDHDWLEYYIEVRDARGAIVTTQGTERNPLLCTLIASKAPTAQKSDSGPSQESGASEPAPEEPTDSLPPRKGPSGDELLTKDEPTDTEALRKGGGFWRSRSYFASLAIGTGVGFVSGKTEVVQSQVHCCLASAPLHLAPELGVQLNESWQISLAARIQVLTLADIETSTLQPARGAFAAMLRARYGSYGAEGGSFAHLDIGGGEVRHVIKVQDQQSKTTKSDTVRAGNFLVGFGGGWRFPLTNRLAAIADVTLLFFAPDFAANFDFSLGMSASF